MLIIVSIKKYSVNIFDNYKWLLVLLMLCNTSDKLVSVCKHYPSLPGLNNKLYCPGHNVMHPCALCRAHIALQVYTTSLQHPLSPLIFIVNLTNTPPGVALADWKFYKTLTIIAAQPWLIGFHTNFYLLFLNLFINFIIFIHKWDQTKTASCIT